MKTKIEKKLLWPSIIAAVIYSVILGAVGIFGEAAAHVIRVALPYVLSSLGLILVVLIPYRVMEAMERNREIRERIEEEKRIARQAEINKKMKAAAERYANMNEMI